MIMQYNTSTIPGEYSSNYELISCYEAPNVYTALGGPEPIKSFDEVESIKTSIPATVFSLGEKYNEISSRGRARIFYKGVNRNHTFISEGFAGKLISTAPYTPLKGIWGSEAEDFKDHGSERTQGRIYGVVMENPNFAWEDHLDDDGVLRTYACVDVIVYTAIYPEAKDIIGKSLSMELLPSSIQGTWEMIDGVKAFAFSEASFAGLQVLGDNVEPCFEGAAFYELKESAQDLYQKILEYEMKNGGTNMSDQNKVNFSCERLNKIWDTLNPDEMSQYSVVSARENDIIVSNGENEFFSCALSEENDEMTIGEKIPVYALFMNEDEHSAYEVLSEKGDFTAIAAEFEAQAAALSEANTLNETLTASLNDKETEFAALNDAIAEKDASIASLTVERDELLAFKCGEDKKKKMSLCEKYSARLDEAVIAAYNANIDNFTYEQLERELAVALVDATPSLFTKGNPMIPKDNPVTGIEAILDQYKK